MAEAVELSAVELLLVTEAVASLLELDASVMLETTLEAVPVADCALTATAKTPVARMEVKRMLTRVCVG